MQVPFEDPVLLGGGQPAVQGDDVGVAQVALGQRVLGIADLPLAGEEDK